ncbi:diguanylate cyclase [Sansalvadorimonas sp. 2012CJ34-2]|uniref:diguanylate cyclase n=1 Tax=Parendozoicomonas callyspongiae TaxID=2942213 RepID=A0ABT0PE41_9GAMM|nr:diguanylate cyclase [Sansalvadorimonas sp. 2012CJ34-2]MCL6269575.1 diguanylate cyclase [Sansalvadorimonas sp. 2012CJ34-2]
MLKKSGLLAMPAILMTIVLTASLSLLTFYFKDTLLKSYKIKLKQIADVTAKVLRDDIELHGDKHIDFDVLATDIGSSSGMRVTIIDPEGVVVGDSKVSSHDLKQMENYGSRPEIQAAMSSGSGLARRFRQALGYDQLYYATKIEINSEGSHADGHQHGASSLTHGEADLLVVRTALALNILGQQMLWIWLWVGGISILGVMIVVIISVLFSKMIDKQASVERSALEGEVKERTHELSLMQRLGSLMSACTTVEGAANVVHPIANHLLPGCTGGAITLIKSSRNRLDLLTQWGEQWKGSERFEPSDCWSLLKGHTHYSFEDGLEIHCAHSANKEDDFQVCIPLVAQGETLGVLHLSYENHEELEANNAKAEAMAEQIGLALANMRLREDLRQQAIRDPLTGLFNRRHMMEFLEQRIYNTETQSAPLSVMMIDLDHFKRFNDTFGHDAGDYVLKQVSMELKQATRETDLVCRYGGEEICIICPDSSLEETAELGRALVARIAGQGMQFNGQSLGNVTISLGVATRQNIDTSVDLLLKDADNALYEAKEQGRNRVIVSSGEDAEGSFPEL